MDDRSLAFLYCPIVGLGFIDPADPVPSQGGYVNKIILHTELLRSSTEAKHMYDAKT